MKTARLITCDSSTEAYIIKAKLEQEGVRCFLTNEHFSSLLPNYNGILGAGIQVMVHEKDLSFCRKLISEELQPETSELICENCGSSDIGLGLGQHSNLKILNVFLTILLLIPIGNQKARYYCKSCKSEVR